MRDFTESQQPALGEAPLAVLPVMKFMHGVKLVTIEAVQGVLSWALTETTEKVTNIVAASAIREGKLLSPSMSFLQSQEQMVLKERAEEMEV